MPCRDLATGKDREGLRPSRRGASGDRTRDLLRATQALSQLSYGPKQSWLSRQADRPHPCTRRRAVGAVPSRERSGSARNRTPLQRFGISVAPCAPTRSRQTTRGVPRASLESVKGSYQGLLLAPAAFAVAPRREIESLSTRRQRVCDTSRITRRAAFTERHATPRVSQDVGKRLDTRMHRVGCGEGGIRTRERVTASRLASVRLQPLGHLSKVLRQRRRGDSNPRWVAPLPLSKRALSTAQPLLQGLHYVAERARFERATPCGAPAFHTGAFSHSATSPVAAISTRRSVSAEGVQPRTALDRCGWRSRRNG